jgi:tripartite-type tricarboxylate transporter receptor subunit TctC
MVGKIIKIKSDGNDALKKLLNDLDIAETINQKQTEQNEKWTPERWYQELKKGGISMEVHGI